MRTEECEDDASGTGDPLPVGAVGHYGPSADAMMVALKTVFDDFAICQNARVLIRHGADGDTRTVRLPRRNGA